MICSACQGSGQAFRDVDSSKYGTIGVHEPCSRCDGTGVDARACAEEIHDAFWWRSTRGEAAHWMESRVREIAQIVARHVRGGKRWSSGTIGREGSVEYIERYR